MIWNGYYGQELEDIKINAEIAKSIEEKIDKLSDLEQIWIWSTDSIRKAKSFKIEKVDVSGLIGPGMVKRVEDYDHFEGVPRGIIMDKNIVDGHHRIVGSTKRITVIRLEK